MTDMLEPTLFDINTDSLSDAKLDPANAQKILLGAGLISLGSSIGVEPVEAETVDTRIPGQYELDLPLNGSALELTGGKADAARLMIIGALSGEDQKADDGNVATDGYSARENNTSPNLTPTRVAEIRKERNIAGVTKAKALLIAAGADSSKVRGTVRFGASSYRR